MTRFFLKLASLALALAALEGCSSLAQPFDQMKSSPSRIYRLQNYEPPAPPPTQAVPAPFQLPPQLQQLAQQLQQTLPPGLLPPGILPGTAPTPIAQDANVIRFEGKRVIGYQDIADSSMRSDIATVFGTESNFTDKYENCPFYEFGFSITQNNNPAPADILVSFSCPHVQVFQINWPYGPKLGLTSDGSKKIADIVRKAFGA